MAAGGAARRRRWRRTTRGPPSGWLAGRVAGGGPREKDIKVRNSQRGERAPPRHRLDRGSLIPLLECSPPPPIPPLSPAPPPPSTTHLPTIRLPLHRSPHDHPPPPTPSNWRAPEYVLYIHTRALMSVPVLLPALPLPPPLRRAERERRRKRDGNRG